jgi:hypothetical protein
VTGDYWSAEPARVFANYAILRIALRSTQFYNLLMSKSTTCLDRLLEDLTRHARTRGLNDSKWATAAGLRKETLSRLRTRGDCDLGTLCALAAAVSSGLAVVPVSTPQGSGPFPDRFDREYEASILSICASGTLDTAAWRILGPSFFMAGVAMMLASARGFDRTSYLHLAEALHPGISHPDIFNGWLARSPLQPSRFIAMLRTQVQHAA